MNASSINKKWILVLTFLMLSVFNYSQNYIVKPASDYFQTFNDKHRIILSAIESRNDLSITQKLVLYESEMGVLKNEFKELRIDEYKSKSIELSVGHSCTKGYSGGVKDCGWKCVSAPNSYSYTRTDWIGVEGDNKGTSVSPDGNSACLKMTRASKGRNYGKLFAEFKYKPESILELVEKETIELFNQISNQSIN